MDRLSQSFESDALAQAQGVSGDVYDQQMSVAASGQTAIVTKRDRRAGQIRRSPLRRRSAALPPRSPVRRPTR